MTQIDRYSIVVAAPTGGQRDLLAEASAISIPNDIESLGDALRWILRDSGYRLADDFVLSDEVHAMLTLPLPAAHRQFEAMPLRVVVELIVGSAFHIVQDPVHRLLAFEPFGSGDSPGAELRGCRETLPCGEGARVQEREARRAVVQHPRQIRYPRARATPGGGD